jgi:hypothetical protein
LLSSSAAFDFHNMAPNPEQLASLRHLWMHAQGCSEQSRLSVTFLLGLYDGRRFPFDLTGLRRINWPKDCLNVLTLDAALRFEGIQDVLGVGARPFEALALDWEIQDIDVLRLRLY